MDADAFAIPAPGAPTGLNGPPPATGEPLLTSRIPAAHPLKGRIEATLEEALRARGGQWHAEVETSPTGAAFAVRLWGPEGERVSFVLREPSCTVERLRERMHRVLEGAHGFKPGRDRRRPQDRRLG